MESSDVRSFKYKEGLIRPNIVAPVWEKSYRLDE
jgi:hypothetical protein